MSHECPKCSGTGVSPLRRAIMAPPGHVIVVRDLSAIEARINAWLSEQEDMVEAFRRGGDIYCDMAKDIFSKTVTEEDNNERFLGKTVTLGCGYGLGSKKFQQMLRVGMLGDKGRILGNDVAYALGVSVDIYLGKNAKYVQESLPPGSDLYTHAVHCACADAIIRLFRANKPMIPEFWKKCNEAIAQIFSGNKWRFGKNDILETCRQGIVLPNGMKMRYIELEAVQNKRSIEYSVLRRRKSGERAKLYGGRVCENVVQALARIVLTDAMLEIDKAGIRVVHQVHDEILTVCKEVEAQQVYDYMGHVMNKSPSWAPDLPLASKGGWHRRYQK